MQNNKFIWLGIGIGITMPFLLVLLVNTILLASGKYLTDGIYQSVVLLGAAINLFGVRYFFKAKREFLSRGILVGSLVVVFFWVIRFVFLDNEF